MSDIRCGVTACLMGLVMLLAAGVTPAHAITFGFTNNITNDSPYVGSQLFVDVTDAGANTVSFTFSNTGPVASSLEGIYFVNSPALFSGISSIGNHAGVNFSAGATPAGLPGGTPFGFGASDILISADSNTPVIPNGINPGESLAVVLSLLAGSDFGDAIDAMFANTLRIGVHVQGIAGGTSDSYLATTPLPGALPLFATGLISLGLLRRRRRRNLAAA
jgi:hypothetical protein